VTLAAIVAAAGALFSRGFDVAPSFDEGVYLAQVDALVHGQGLGSDVFAAQPPGFYWLLRVAAWLGGLGVHQVRTAVLILALAGVVLAYAVGRFAAGPGGGLIAAAALTIVPSYGVSAVRVSADLPGTVFALASLACLLAPWERGARVRLALAGALLAFAELVKLDAFILVVPVASYFAWRRRSRADLVAFGGAAALVVGAAALALGGSIGAVWRGAVSYHVAARAVSGGYSQNLHELAGFLHPRQPFTTLLVLAVVATVLDRRLLRTLWPFWVSAVGALAFVLWHRPLHDNHMVLLAVAAATATGVSLGATIGHIRRGRAVATGVVVVLLAAGYVQSTRQAQRNALPVPAGLPWAAKQVARLTPPGALVVSDEPLVPFLAHRQMPGRIIDTALLRFSAGYLDDRTVIRASAEPRVAAVVVGRAFLSRPKLLSWIVHHFVRAGERDGVSVYVRRP
jgi:hypothetical protein